MLQSEASVRTAVNYPDHNTTGSLAKETTKCLQLKIIRLSG